MGLGLFSLNVLVFSESAYAEKTISVDADKETSRQREEESEPGWFGDDYEACLKGGGGNSCTCGERTNSKNEKEKRKVI